MPSVTPQNEPERWIPNSESDTVGGGLEVGVQGRVYYGVFIKRGKSTQKHLNFFGNFVFFPSENDAFLSYFLHQFVAFFF